MCVHQEDCGQDNAYYYDVDYSVMFIEPSPDHFMKMQRHSTLVVDSGPLKRELKMNDG